MALEIVDTHLSSMQRLTVFFTLPDAAYEIINIIATDGTNTINEPLANLSTGTDENNNPVLIGRSTSRFVLNETYTIHLETDAAETGDSLELTMELSTSNQQRIQQAVFDTISASDIVDSNDTTYTIACDAAFVPDDMGNDVPSPFITVGKPKIQASETIALNLLMITHELLIKIKDAEHDDAATDVSHMHEAAQKIIGRIKAGGSMGMHNLGFKTNCADCQIVNPEDIVDDDILNSVIISVQLTQIQPY